MPANDQSLKSLLRELITEVTELVRQELRLAQAEASEKVSQAQHSIVAIIAGLLLAFSALLVLLQAAVVALAEIMPGWLASVIVGVVVAIVAFILVKQGQNGLSARKLVPERTMHAMRRDKDLILEKAP